LNMEWGRRPRTDGIERSKVVQGVSIVPLQGSGREVALQRVRKMSAKVGRKGEKCGRRKSWTPVLHEDIIRSRKGSC